ncbi:MAG: hypothetical protein Q8Q60_00885 [Candidatus Chromulinivorax sp.]|nr:hypothetical protein [Candidatus Chromulinivorax sp.]
MRNKLFIFLMIAGLSQCTEILSSHRNRPRKTQQQIEQEKEAARREKDERTRAWHNQEPEATKSTTYIHKNQFAALTENKKTKNLSAQSTATKIPAVISQVINLKSQNNHDSDRDYESDDSDASGIHFKFGAPYYSVNRTSGHIIKTHLIKEDRLHKYVNNLEMSHETLQKFHGKKLCADELKDLLEIEKEERPSRAK